VTDSKKEAINSSHLSIQRQKDGVPDIIFSFNGAKKRRAASTDGQKKVRRDEAQGKKAGRYNRPERL